MTVYLLQSSISGSQEGVLHFHVRLIRKLVIRSAWILKFQRGVLAERIINMVPGLISKKKLYYRCFLCCRSVQKWLLHKSGTSKCMCDWLTCLISWKRKRRTIGFANANIHFVRLSVTVYLWSQLLKAEKFS